MIDNPVEATYFRIFYHERYTYHNGENDCSYSKNWEAKKACEYGQGQPIGRRKSHRHDDRRSLPKRTKEKIKKLFEMTRKLAMHV